MMTHWIRQVSRPLLVVIMVALVGSSAPASAAREPQTPEEMYQLAVRLLDHSNFQRSVELLERIKTRYPFSQYAVLAELRIGDSHFKKGEYPEAVDSYQSFIKLHPRHPEVDYVIYMIAKSEFEQAPSVAQRDQAATKRMLSAIQTFEERFPNSKYTTEVQKMRLEGRRRLAQGVFAVGKFYYRRGRFVGSRQARTTAFEAAIHRFDQVVDEYPDVKDIGAEALFYMGHCQARLHRKADVLNTLDRLKTRFPESRRIARLTAIAAHTRGTPIPPPPGPESQPAEGGGSEGAPGEGALEGAPEGGEGAPEGGAPETAPEAVPEAAPEPAPEAAPETAPELAPDPSGQPGIDPGADPSANPE
jgi:outer membrane protein assembly factor BamD